MITLTKVPNSLRGDLTKWCQEIQTGVYVGNVSAKIRDGLWDRIMRDIGNGQATMVYNTNNELGYTFKTTRSDRDVIDYDGIPLMMHLVVSNKAVKHGFSDAAKFHKAKIMTHKRLKTTDKLEKALSESIVSIDIETTGLDVTKDQIIAIGAAKKNSCFYSLIKSNTIVPEKISDLTGLTSTILSDEGMDLKVVLIQLKEFIGNLPIVGYNVRFDEAFLEKGYKDTHELGLSNKIVDLMPVIKKTNKFLDNYRLKTVLEDYKISNLHPHRADSDAKATFELAIQLIKKQDLKI
ncbi:3-5 exonuclease [Liquorilactobacillus aquaticus DSM 21051]|uniref:DNA polymerase III polC-type n=1 Tax=Liquorilactobacillus aquaticus DSM 21051 TaxID=1423725 RepID=A0A0R2CUL8_9LACO|nr:3-5 exonuclease [Liquorilactobacillus aquaticus DSM 21051]